MATEPATGPKTGDKLAQRIRVRSRGLSPSLVRVLNFIDANRLEAMTKSAVELGKAIGTSDATVIRAVQALGFEGLKDLKQELAVSFGRGHSAADNMVRTFTGIGEKQEAAIDLVLQDHRDAFEALSAEETRAQISGAVKILMGARRIGVFGLGPSSYLARYFGLVVSRSGRPTRVFDGSGEPLPDQLLYMQELDAMVMLAYGRPYKEATAVLAEARRLRKPVVLVTDSVEKGLSSHASVVVTVHRGSAGRVALHGATFVCLEAIMLALASLDKPRAIETLERLNELRRAVGKAPQ